MASKVFLAIDVGASSGRHLAGSFDGKRLSLEEVYRFENGPVAAAGRLYWDVLNQWAHLGHGLRAAASQHGDRIESVGIDTWGVDFALLGRGDELLGNPCHYRDPRTEGVMDRAFAEVSREEIFSHTGLQFMQINTLYQLLAMRFGNSPLLAAAESFLMMPDLLHWLLTGVKANEMTIASTSQCYDPRQRAWATEMLRRFKLPTSIFGQIVLPGERLGPLLPSVAGATGLKGVSVVVPGAHDTASAVMAVPAAAEASQQPDWCYISSGTWSLMGVELPSPVVNDECLRLNFTNEGGVGGTTRLLKNICGLWLVQECRRVWSEGGTTYSWDYLTQQAADAAPLRSFIDPDDPALLAPSHMPKAIGELCQRRGQPVPETEGAIIRCCLESIALKYRRVLEWLEQLTGARIRTIHIVGGGTQNRQLCQMAADACQRRVVAGPIEATAIGNILVQAIASGAIGSIAEAREIVRGSFSVETYEPRDVQPWDEAYGRFMQVEGRTVE